MTLQILKCYSSYCNYYYYNSCCLGGYILLGENTNMFNNWELKEGQRKYKTKCFGNIIDQLNGKAP